MRALLISTYDLGRQPFALASAATWLRDAGVEAACNDLDLERLDEDAARQAELVAIHLPMHTATRLAAELLPRLRSLNPAAHICCFGLYAPLNEAFLKSRGADSCIGGEFEGPLARLAESLRDGNPAESGLGESGVSLARQTFRVPRREGLPALERYARLRVAPGEERIVGTTEATRGCKHLCRHCPIVPVYKGAFRVVGREVVLEDIRRQVAAGAQHITFADPDFLNGPAHGMAIARALHGEFPGLTYDVTIKVEHLLRHAELLPELRETGALIVTSAFESTEDTVLERLDKRHTRADLFRAVDLVRGAGLNLNPTFVPFTPWSTAAGYLDLLNFLAASGLMDATAPVQLAIRLLIPAHSELLTLPETRALVGAFDEETLAYPWAHPDPALDTLAENAMAIVMESQDQDGPEDRRAVFSRLLAMAGEAARETAEEAQIEKIADIVPPFPLPPSEALPPFAPHMTEAWYC